MDARPALTRREMLAASTSGTAIFLVGCGSAGGPAPGAGSGATPASAIPAVAYTDTAFAAGQDGAFFEIDTLGHRVTQVLPNGSVGWETAPGSVNGPQDVALDSAGHVCVASLGDAVIHVYDAQGSWVTDVGRPGDAPGEFASVRDLAFDANDLLYVADGHNHRVQVLNGAGAVVRIIGGPGRGAGEFNCPRALAFDSRGDLHVLDAGNFRIQVFDASGAFLREYGYYGRASDEFLTPSDLAIDRDDRVYVADPGMLRILVFEDAGQGHVSSIEPVDGDGHRLVPLRVALGPDGGLLLTAHRVLAPGPVS